MCQRRTVSSCCVMQRHGVSQHAVAEVWADGHRGQEIHLPAQDLPQLAFHADEGDQTGYVSRLELHEQVDVALGPEVRSQHGPKDREPAGVVTSAEVADRIARAVDRREAGSGYGEGQDAVILRRQSSAPQLAFSRTGTSRTMRPPLLSRSTSSSNRTWRFSQKRSDVPK